MYVVPVVPWKWHVKRSLFTETKTKKKVLQEKSQHAYNLNLKTAMKALDDNIEKGKPEIDSASDTENASETENVFMDTNSDHDYSPPGY